MSHTMGIGLLSVDMMYGSVATHSQTSSFRDDLILFYNSCLLPNKLSRSSQSVWF